MKRTLSFGLFTAILAVGTCLAQTNSRAAARPEMVPAPVASGSAPAVPAHPSPYNFPGVQCPRIEADSRVTLRLTAPSAEKEQVSIVNVPLDMVKGADGVWTYTSEPQAPGYHNYWMMVYGAIVLDPGPQAFIGYGHMCNGFEVPEPGVDWYDIKDVPHGHVTAENYFAKSINAWRHIYVYTPPGYDANLKTRYPVFYLQHGGGEDERVWIEMGRTNVILDNLLAQGKVKPMIVVMETSATGAPDAAGGRPGVGRGPSRRRCGPWSWRCPRSPCSCPRPKHRGWNWRSRCRRRGTWTRNRRNRRSRRRGIRAVYDRGIDPVGRSEEHTSELES